VDRWFDRSFTLGLPASSAPEIIERLRRAPDRLAAAVRDLSEPLRVHRPAGRWSIQEHAGHLLDLEPLLDRRLDDFDAGARVLHAADLQNRKTHEGRHNERPAGELLAAFGEQRGAILSRVERMTQAELSRVALHPRLQQPMSVVDLCFFVAEHDDHHLRAIAEIVRAHVSDPLYALDLVNAIDASAPRLMAMDDAATSRRPSPGKWSPREIIGHLIDSASNNHQRFVRAIFQEDLVFPGYTQDEWVAAQRYQDAAWTELVTLWASYNRHLSRVMTAMPEEVRQKLRRRHNLHEIAFHTVPPDTPATLDYFMADYVQHLRHHLRQIFERP